MSRPFLTAGEKQWLALQLVAAVAGAHSEQVPHLDIKADNAFVTSWGHLYLTDFAHFKPVYLGTEDILTQLELFFETSSNTANRAGRCYLAPERLTETPSVGPSVEVLKRMDIFSLGCVLAELGHDQHKVLTARALGQN